ncbi:hypothetical protein [Georgenia faecalis]|uniref:hypothetical protein n=1 Tax=Georgenia faecalis TaxID=2483799 RepID=UPI000FD6DC0E|nr:hypothetical protein [Georgenia faecalis]
MTEQAVIELRRFSVMGTGRVQDVVVDARARLGDVLDELGLPPFTEALSPGGERLSRSTVLLAAGIPDGAVLVAVDGESLAPSAVRSGGAYSAAHAPGSRASGPALAGSAAPGPVAGAGGAVRVARAPGALRPALAGRLAAGAGSVLAALVVLTVLLPGAGRDAAVPGALLLLGALVVSWIGGGVRAQVAAATGAAAGAALLAVGLVPALPAGTGHLAVVAGALGAVVSAVVGRDVTPLARRISRTLVTTGLLTAAGGALAVVASWPVTVLAVVAVAAAVPLARILPDVVVDVDTTEIVDLDRLSTTAWSPRPRRARTRWRHVVREDVDGQVRDAARHQRIVLVGVLAVVALGAATLVLAAPGPSLATTILLATVGTGLALVARRYYDRADRWLLRLAGFAAIAAGGVRLAAGLPDGAALALAVGLAVAAFGLVLLAPVVGRGWTSLGLGRLADVFEVLTVTAALPLAVWAAGLVPWVRALVA